MDLGVRGKVFVIFGGTRGIGLAAARALVAEGGTVVLVGRDEARVAQSATSLGASAASAIGIAADLRKEGEAERVLRSARAKAGQIHGLAVTTGLGYRGHRDLLTASDDDWCDVFDDVLLATVRACRAGIPFLLEAGGGAIVTTAAYSVHAPSPHQVPYASLKAGVVTLTKTIAKGYGSQGIRANCVCPGATETDVLASMRVAIAEERGIPLETALERVMVEEWGMHVALGRAGRPEEVGDVIAFLLSERAAYVTGALLNVDGGTDF
jgi:NAD(P)-dependent dehydrogenase (short-subunit alcohol dehydrogenase family)